METYDLGMHCVETFQVDEIQFILDTRPGSQRASSSDGSFVLVKTKKLLSFYEGLRDTLPKNILEIGMFQGGSLVYFDKLFQPDILVGMDICTTPIAPLEQYKESRPYIKTYYGCSQDQPPTRVAAQASFPAGIDLVVDDASHLYAQTKATFENIFPLVKPGGLYVIEDWAWSHRLARQTPNAIWSNQPALTNLIFNLTVLAAVSQVIDSLTITEHLVCVKKGFGTLPPGRLDMQSYLRGKELPLI